jgi:hypothetical protein
VAPGADGEKVKTPDKLIIHQNGGRTMFEGKSCSHGRSYTLLVKVEPIFLASHLFQAQIQICCCSIEELITKIV